MNDRKMPNAKALVDSIMSDMSGDVADRAAEGAFLAAGVMRTIHESGAKAQEKGDEVHSERMAAALFGASIVFACFTNPSDTSTLLKHGALHEAADFGLEEAKALDSGRNVIETLAGIIRSMPDEVADDKAAGVIEKIARMAESGMTFEEAMKALSEDAEALAAEALIESAKE